MQLSRFSPGEIGLQDHFPTMIAPDVQNIAIFRAIAEHYGDWQYPGS